MPDVLLVHGGFHPAADAEGFWVKPGVVDGLTRSGFRVIGPNRAAQPCTWQNEGRHLAATIEQHSSDALIAVAGSNGCSAAVRAAVDHPSLVHALILCWPATAGDPVADGVGRRALADLGWSPSHIDELFRGETLRGVMDNELRELDIPVVVIPSDPYNPTHQKHTVDRILDLVPAAKLGSPFPETPTSLFPPRRMAFLAELTDILNAL